jgi:uncharacterized membrane protein
MSQTIDVNPDGSTGAVRNMDTEVRTAYIVYLLHALAPFTAWLLAALAVFIGFLKRDDVRGTYLDSHYAWLGGAFWWSLGWLLMAGAFYIVGTIITLGIGAVVLWVVPAAVYGVLWIWYVYRVVRGWLTLNDRKPIA